MEDYPFITEIEGDTYLEPESYEDRKVDLTEIFELYASPEFEASQVARFVGIDESDVWNAVFYWSGEDEVYEELVEEANLGPDSNIVSRETEKEFRDFVDESAPEAFDPLQTAVSKFMELRDRDETQISEQNIIDFPEETYLGERFDESHLSWTREGKELEVHAGWDRSRQEDTAVLSYSVESEVGEKLEVHIDEVGDRVLEMYRNAVFTSLEK